MSIAHTIDSGRMKVLAAGAATLLLCCLAPSTAHPSDLWQHRFMERAMGELADLAPDLGDIRQQLNDDPTYAHLSAEDLDQLASSFLSDWSARRYFGLLGMLESCSTDITALCTEHDGDPACLIDNGHRLNSCCAVTARNTLEDDRFPLPESHNGIVLPDKAGIHFEPDCGASELYLGSLAWLDEHAIGPAVLRFDREKRLTHATLLEDQSIGGFHFTNSDHALAVHPNGLPKEATLARDSTVDGIRWAADGRAMRFAADGSVLDGRLAEPMAVASIRLPAEARYTEADGRGRYRFVTSDPTRLAALDVPVGSAVTVDQDGTPIDLRPSRHLVHDGRLHPFAGLLEFDASGDIAVDHAREAYARANEQGYWNVEELVAAKSVSDVLLPAGSILFRSRTDDALKTALVPTAIRAHGLMVGPGAIAFEPQRGVVAATLSPGQTYHGWALGSERPARDDGHMLLSSGVSIPPHDSAMTHFRDGRPTSIWLAAEAVQRGLPFAAGDRVELHANGRIKKGATARETRTGLLSVPNDAEVWFDEAGALSRLQADAPVSEAGIAFDGRSMYFWPNGRVRDAVLVDRTGIDGQVYRGGTQLLMSSEGHVLRSRAGERRWPEGYAPPPEPTPAQLLAVTLGTSHLRMRLQEVPPPCPDSDKPAAVGFSFAPLAGMPGCDGRGNDGMLRAPR